jgi:hypothetical protein
MADPYGPNHDGPQPTNLATDDRVRFVARVADAVPDRNPRLLHKHTDDERAHPGPGTCAGGAR